METVLGFSTITLSIIIAVSGTALHQIRAYDGKPIPKIMDGVMATVAGSFVAAHTALSEVTVNDPFQQVLLVMSLIGFIVPSGMLGQKIFSKVKKTRKKPKEEKLQRPLPIKKGKFLSIPKLGPADSWYQTNFKKSDKGNFLQYGQVHLWIRIRDVKSYVTAILKDANGIALQVDQSHEYDEDSNIETTRLELLKADGTPFPRGIYHLAVRGDRGTGDSQGIRDDVFEIV